MTATAGDLGSGNPVFGSKNRGGVGVWWKSKAEISEPDLTSKDPLPILPRFQLFSMNLMIEVWSVRTSKIKFFLAKGEITRSGSRGPYPHLSLIEFVEAGVPQRPVGPRSASYWGSCDSLTIGGITWSYHPSESS